MSTLSFFDVSIAGGRVQYSPGEEISVHTLVRSALSQQSDSPKSFGMIADDQRFDPYGLEKPGQWERIVSTMIYCLSGQVPDRQEVLRGRQILYRLPKWFKKKHVDEQFVLGFLPYVLIGFKAHTEDRFQADSNRIDDLCRFIVHLYESASTEVTSYLCAHRGFAPTGQHVLLDAVRIDKAERTLNLQRALVANVRQLTSRKIRWYQQGPTAMASSNMFPEMFMQYMEHGKVPELLTLLEKHWGELGALGQTTSSVDFEVAQLDLVTEAAHRYLDSRFGLHWRTTDFDFGGCSRPTLVSIALEQAMPEIKRLIPFYGTAHAAAFAKTESDYLETNLRRAREIETDSSDNALTRRTAAAISWFYRNQFMHATAKALYEAAFYYVWGQAAAATPNGVAIGIDRDHAGYQYSAWMLGYAEARKADQANTAIVYARRSPIELPGHCLGDISFRQFWR